MNTFKKPFLFLFSSHSEGTLGFLFYFIKNLLLTAPFFIIYLNLSIDNKKSPPKVINGKINLETWDFDRDGPIELKGDWGQHLGRFLKPSYDFNLLHWQGAVLVPFQFGDLKMDDGLGKSGIGFGSYLLKIENMPSDPMELAVYMGNVPFSYSLYQSSYPEKPRLISQNGVISKKAAGARYHTGKTIGFINKKAENAMHLLLHASNFKVPFFKQPATPILATPKQAKKIFAHKAAWHGLFLGVLFLLALNALNLFFIHNGHKGFLAFFYIACLCFSYYLFETGYAGFFIPKDTFPHLFLSVSLPLILLSLFPASITFYMGHFYENPPKKAYIFISLSISIVLALLCFFELYASLPLILIAIWLHFLAVTFLFCSFFFTKASFLTNGKKVALLSCGLLGVASIFDMLSTLLVMPFESMTPFWALFFLFSQKSALLEEIRHEYDKSKRMSNKTKKDLARAGQALLQEKRQNEASYFENLMMLRVICHDFSFFCEKIRFLSQKGKDYGKENSSVELIRLFDDIKKVSSQGGSLPLLLRNRFLAKKDIKRFPLSSVSLGDIVAKTQFYFRRELDKKQISFEVQGRDLDSTFVVAEPISLCSIVFLNLMQNCINACQRGNKITLSVTKLKDNKVEVRLKDEGVGMSEKMLKDVFNKRYALDLKDFGGPSLSGMSFMVCQSYFSLYGARFEVLSNKGSQHIKEHGTTCIMTFESAKE